MERGALFSPCRTWRYVLWRTWDETLGHVMFTGLNSSTADETNNDPTVSRCINYGQRWGYGGIYMLNIFAFRATDPKRMKAALDPVGPDNDEYLWIYHTMSAITVACWGTHGAFRDRGAIVANMLGDLYCLGKTKDGYPKHPLYLKSDLRPILYE